MKPANQQDISSILIYGLSANPVHQGHADLVKGAVENLLKQKYNITQILIVPVYRRNPVGSPKDNLPDTYEHRFRMCEFLAQEVMRAYPRCQVRVSRVEEHLARNSEKPNYTAETLSYLKEYILKEMDFIFLISSGVIYGANPEFSQWHKIDTILKLTSLAVCPRPGFPINYAYIDILTEMGGRFIILDSVKTLNISSTELRIRISQGENPLSLAEKGLISQSVGLYLQETGLYLHNKNGFSKPIYNHETEI
jgi:nicotinate (nicotinamide) nucleotide adenylyltransferase